MDRSQDRSEYIDERYFRLLAGRFRRANRHADIHLDAFDEDDSAEFLADIEKPAYRGLDLFAYIGHGGQQQLYSADWGLRNIEPADLAQKLRAACNDGAVIVSCTPSQPIQGAIPRNETAPPGQFFLTAAKPSY